MPDSPTEDHHDQPCTRPRFTDTQHLWLHPSAQASDVQDIEWHLDRMLCVSGDGDGKRAMSMVVEQAVGMLFSPLLEAGKWAVAPVLSPPS